jgi:succinate dehydrogenase / fumarate reductase cytochrome b subunit
MAGAKTDARPLSPHLSIWRWHITMFGSILHRATGIILYAGAIGLVAWLCLLVAGEPLYSKVMSLAPPWLILAKLYAVTAVLAYHTLNGIRHLAWDVGAGFNPKTANATGWLVLLLSLASPLGLYALIMMRS